MKNCNIFPNDSQSFFIQKTPTVLLTTKQAAEYLGISPATLNTWRCTKRNVVPYIKVGGRHVRYRLVDFEAYINANVVAG